MFNEIKIDCPCNSKKNLSWTDAWGPVSRLLICSAEIRGGGGGGGGGGGTSLGEWEHNNKSKTCHMVQ